VARRGAGVLVRGPEPRTRLSSHHSRLPLCVGRARAGNARPRKNTPQAQQTPPAGRLLSTAIEYVNYNDAASRGAAKSGVTTHLGTGPTPRRLWTMRTQQETRRSESASRQDLNSPPRCCVRPTMLREDGGVVKAVGDDGRGSITPHRSTCSRRITVCRALCSTVVDRIVYPPRRQCRGTLALQRHMGCRPVIAVASLSAQPSQHNLWSLARWCALPHSLAPGYCLSGEWRCTTAPSHEGWSMEVSKSRCPGCRRTTAVSMMPSPLPVMGIRRHQAMA
jgi:hypothetical protein